MNRVFTIVLACIACSGCITPNMNREPNRWITVIDIDTGKPVPNIPLAYFKIKKPYWIVGQVMVSREYITDAKGRAHVPSGVYLEPLPDAYILVEGSEMEKFYQNTKKANTIYVRTVENYMKKLNETEQPHASGRQQLPPAE